MQPASTEIQSRTAAIIQELKGLEGPLLPILHEIQEEFGHVPQDAVPVIADGLNLSRAEVHGVVTFYHDFRREPAGLHVLKLCRAEACQSAGGNVISERIRTKLGIQFGETSADGRVTLDAVYCLGLCATAPSAMLDGQLVGRLTAPKLDALLKDAGA